MAGVSDIDRLGVRRRPRGLPIMHQTWEELLFLHWRTPEDLLRPLIPSELEIDTFEGSAWIGVTPFTMHGVRPILVPALPGVSAAHELNVRTYVVHEGVPGVWFFSLDASNSLAVLFARLGFSLPYFRASMSLIRDADGTVRFSSEREHRDAPSAHFEAAWRRHGETHEAAPDTLEFFLVERYCLYTVRGDTLKQARIHHEPWTLQDAHLLSLESSMIASHGLPEPDDEPLLHAQAAALEVEVWPLK